MTYKTETPQEIRQLHTKIMARGVNQQMSPGYFYTTLYGGTRVWVRVGECNQKFTGADDVEYCYAGPLISHAKRATNHSFPVFNVQRTLFTGDITRDQGDFCIYSPLKLVRVQEVVGNTVVLAERNFRDGEEFIWNICKSVDEVKGYFTKYVIRQHLYPHDAVWQHGEEIIAHLMCESLGYFSPKAALNCLTAYLNGEGFPCEWLCSMVRSYDQGKVWEVTRDIVHQALFRKEHHTGYMADYQDALRIIKRVKEGSTAYDLASWF